MVQLQTPGLSRRGPQVGPIFSTNEFDQVPIRVIPSDLASMCSVRKGYVEQPKFNL